MAHSHTTWEECPQEFLYISSVVNYSAAGVTRELGMISIHHPPPPLTWGSRYVLLVTNHIMTFIPLSRQLILSPPHLYTNGQVLQICTNMSAAHVMICWLHSSSEPLFVHTHHFDMNFFSPSKGRLTWGKSHVSFKAPSTMGGGQSQTPPPTPWGKVPTTAAHEAFSWPYPPPPYLPGGRDETVTISRISALMNAKSLVPWITGYIGRRGTALKQFLNNYISPASLCVCLSLYLVGVTYMSCRCHIHNTM